MTTNLHMLSKEIFLNAYSIFWLSLDWIFPPNCAGCGLQGYRICPDCLMTLEYTSGQICSICGRPLKNNSLCTSCKLNVPNFTQMRSVFLYKGVIREAIHNLKYENDLGLAEILSNYMFLFQKKLDWDIDIIVPVPLNQFRYKERGYNQAALLSYPLSLRTEAKYQPNAIRRIKNTKSQVGLNEIQRFENVSEAFVADRTIVQSKSVLIIDDVATTGATINAVAHATKKAGAKNIYCLTLARALHLSDNLQ